MKMLQLPTINDQMQIAGQASRARAERDQKQFVRQVFQELSTLENKIDTLTALVEALTKSLEKAPKAAKVEKE